MNETADIEAIARARLRTMRQSLGWSLDELAARAHLSPSTISRIETGKRTISIDVLLALSRALHVDIAALLELGGEDEDVVIRPHSTSDAGPDDLAAEPGVEQHRRRQAAHRGRCPPR